MIIPEDITARVDRAIDEAHELQIATDELQRLAAELNRANEMLRDWFASQPRISN